MKITRREKLFLWGGGLFVGLFILVAGIVMPAINTRDALEQEMTGKDAQLREVYALAGKIKAAEKLHNSSRRSGAKDFTLFGYLEELAGTLGVKDQIEYMKPLGDSSRASGESVEIKINAIYVEDLIGLMHGIQNCPCSLEVRRLNIRRMDRNKNIDVTFQVILYG